MKKIIGLVGMAALLAASVFAVDFSVSADFEANVIAGDESGVNSILTPLSSDYSNGLSNFVLEADGEKAGAYFKFKFYNGDGDADTISSYVASSYAWVQPIDMLKLTIGEVGNYLYCEQINWWMVGSPFALNQRVDGTYSQYASCADGDDYGLGATITPSDALTLTATFAPGADLGFWDGSEYAQWGTTVKYQVTEAVSVGAAYRDWGEDSYKIARIGADFTVGNFYGFVQPEVGFDSDYEVQGYCLDNYVAYTKDALTVLGRFPVTISQDADTDANPSSIEWEVKGSYALESCTPYLDIYTPTYTADTWIFSDDFADSIGLVVEPGVSFSIGEASIETGVSATFNSELAGSGIDWSVPLTLTMSL